MPSRIAHMRRQDRRPPCATDVHRLLFSAPSIALKLIGICILVAVVTASPRPAVAQTAPSWAVQGDVAARCASLARLDLENVPDAPTRITAAQLVEVTAAPDNAAPNNPLAVLSGSPIKWYCQVTGYVSPQNKFELRLPLPADWNNKFFFSTCKGFCGAVVGSACNASLARGYASVTTNGGHDGPPMFDGYWARNAPNLQEDFAWRGTHVVTVAAKEITARYYGRSIVHSYISGCSKGGHAVMMETQRFPQDYDGAIPIAPVYDLGTGPIRALWLAQAVSDGHGGSVLNTATAAAVHKSILATCGAQSGVDDGMVTDPISCGWRPERMACRATRTDADCLSPAQVLAIAKVMQLPVNSKGQIAYFAAILPGTETNWEGWLFPRSTDGTIRDTGMHAYAEQFMRYLAQPVTDVNVEPLRFSLDSAPRYLARASRVYDATSTDLRAFKQRGGKMVMWHGLADGSVSATGTVHYYKMLTKSMGGRVDDFVRLFLVPGVHHCAGGPGPDDLDALSALENWVEHGIAPDVIIARHLTNGVVDRSRPVYPYPTLTRYAGMGDPTQASSFVPLRPKDR
ncbi:MAG: tannase/feruloyl esterase family alpha/beta hydrolase [Gemmatimonadaceae bacterium]